MGRPCAAPIDGFFSGDPSRVQTNRSRPRDTRASRGSGGMAVAAAVALAAGGDLVGCDVVDYLLRRHARDLQ